MNGDSTTDTAEDWVTALDEAEKEAIEAAERELAAEDRSKMRNLSLSESIARLTKK